ncbi:hypothetical protein D3C81_458700 [compost metagenome]
MKRSDRHKQKKSGPGKPVLSATTSSSSLVTHSKVVTTAAVEARADLAGADVATIGLESARMQWQFGDWASLSAISIEQLAEHPDRAKLALLVAAAKLQLDEIDAARPLLRHALTWGASRQEIASILLAGTHNVLGRVAAISGDEFAAISHFSKSAVGQGGDARLVSKARMLNEAGRLGLWGNRLLGAEPSVAQYSSRRSTEGGAAGRVDVDMPDAAFLPKPGSTSAFSSNGNKGYDIPALVRQGRVSVVVAGMRHSGSTALFNIVREAMELAELRFESFYSEGAGGELFDDPEQGLLLIKTHEFRDDVASRATVVLNTRRDLRDTVASAKRRGFPLMQRVGGVTEYAKYNRTLHEMWFPRGDYEFVYEDYISHPEREIRRVLEFLGLDVINAGRISKDVQNLPTDQYSKLLLSPLHITDPERILSYRDSLTAEEIKTIQMNHGGWLRRHGYEVERS